MYGNGFDDTVELVKTINTMWEEIPYTASIEVEDYLVQSCSMTVGSEVMYQ